MTTQNPFPGMNPFFEKTWRDAHTQLIAYMRDDLQPRLPPDLVARTEEGVTALATAKPVGNYYPDVTVSEPWNLREGGTAVAPEPALIAAEPIRVLREHATERWIEIRDSSGRLITVIELLSPTNKWGDGYHDYQRKRASFIASGTNLVEIDLVRVGTSVFPDAVRATLEEARACYGVCVSRAADSMADEVYPIRLRERLAAIRIPLRETDADITLGLQPLIDRCHEGGRYHMLNYQADPPPPFLAEDASWMDGVLKKAGLRG